MGGAAAQGPPTHPHRARPAHSGPVGVLKLPRSAEDVLRIVVVPVDEVFFNGSTLCRAVGCSSSLSLKHSEFSKRRQNAQAAGKKNAKKTLDFISHWFSPKSVDRNLVEDVTERVKVLVLTSHKPPPPTSQKPGSKKQFILLQASPCCPA